MELILPPRLTLDSKLTTILTIQIISKQKINGTIILRYFGHSSFMWSTSGGTRILIDPFGNPEGREDWFLRKFPRVHADVLLISHPHFDHGALDRVEGDPLVLGEPGETSGEDYSIEAVEGKHAKSNSAGAQI